MLLDPSLQRIVFDDELFRNIGNQVLTLMFLSALLHLSDVFHFFQVVLRNNFDKLLLKRLFFIFAKIEHLGAHQRPFLTHLTIFGYGAQKVVLERFLDFGFVELDPVFHHELVEIQFQVNRLHFHLFRLFFLNLLHNIISNFYVLLNGCFGTIFRFLAPIILFVIF